MRRALAVAVLSLSVLLAAACTPEQIAATMRLYGKHAHVISHDGLARLRACESGGNYRAVSSSGTYRGAYQFDQRTWNGVAGRHYPWLVGDDPAGAWPWEQDAQARALWSERGPQPWPVCGRRV